MLSCEGLDELNTLLDKIESKRIFLLFYANLIDGKSWCPDCVAAKPIIDDNMKYLEKNSDTFITVYVGDKPTWKDPEHVLRHDDRFKVTGVPTLMLYKTDKRLVEPECQNGDLIKNLFLYKDENITSKL